MKSRLNRWQQKIHRNLKNQPRPLTSLQSWVTQRENLRLAWDRVCRNTGASTPGPDGLTIAQVGEPSDWLNRLGTQLQAGEWEPSPPLRIDVLKKAGSTETRPLGILSLADRVVHSAVKQVLEVVLEPGFHPCSHGFRPGRSVPSALQSVLDQLQQGIQSGKPYTHAAHLDVARCFDSLCHQSLFSRLQQEIGDEELLGLLRGIAAVSAAGQRGWWWKTPVGLTQGSPISPLLCNFYLHPLDTALDDFSTGMGGNVQLFRYADDLLLLGRNRRALNQGIRCVKSVLKSLHLRLSSGKSRVSPLQTPIRWLGVDLSARRNHWSGETRYGYRIPEDKCRRMLETLIELTTPPHEKLDAGTFNAGQWIASVNEQLRQWRETYRYSENAREVWGILDDCARERMKQVLRKLTGLRGSHLHKACRVYLPRGFWTWQADGVQLVNLSRETPRHPGQLTRKPAWQRAKTIQNA